MPNKKHWEHDSKNEALIRIVGFDFGKNPEEKEKELLDHKKIIAENIFRVAESYGIKSDPVVLEIGCGIGLISRYIAAFVKKLYCCDISESYLKIAKQECRDIKNINFFQIFKASDFYFLDKEKIDFIFAHAVFIHLNLYDIFLYFSEFNRILSDQGIIYFDIKCADFLDLNNDKYFLEQVGHYKKDPSVLPELLQWNSLSAIKKIAEYFGFELSFNRNNNELLFLKSKNFVRKHINYKSKEKLKDEIIIQKFNRRVKISNNYFINVKYKVSENREILVDMFNTEWKCYGYGRIGVEKGKGTKKIKIDVFTTLTPKYGYFYQAHILPPGKTFKESITLYKSDYFEIIE